MAAYGGKLRYTLSYTAGAQGSSLSDPDIQIMVSTRFHAGRAEGRSGVTLIVSSVLSVQHSAGLARARGVGVTPCSHLNIWLHTTQAEAQLPGEGGSVHVPDSFWLTS